MPFNADRGTMLSIVISIATSLVAGAITGYWFERRQSRATRQHNAELEHKLRALREGIYSVGRGSALASPQVSGNLEDRVNEWILNFQGPDGTVSRHRVAQRFLSEGESLEQILAALVRLDERGTIKYGEEIRIP